MTENFVIGLQLLSIGMGFVLAFLCILIVAMFGMSAVVGYLNKLFPEQIEVVERKSAKSAGNDDAAIAAAIAAVFARK